MKSDKPTNTWENVGDLERHFGPLVTGRDLLKLLGFPTSAALRQAHKRGHVPVRLFSLRGRRGKFAMTRDVVSWLKTLRTDPIESASETSDE